MENQKCTLLQNQKSSITLYKQELTLYVQKVTFFIDENKFLVVQDKATRILNLYPILFGLSSFFKANSSN